MLTPGRNFSFIERLTAFFLSAVLIISGTSAGYAYPSSNTSISIPKELGKIEETFTGTSGKTIIYIQDAHDSLEAQDNIVKLINNLVEHYGIQTVLEEGYGGPVPTDDYFGFIQDPAIREKVSYFLLDHLRIGGAEYAHINRKTGFKLIGADNIKLHLKNIHQYQKSARHRMEVAKELGDAQKEIEKLANQNFPGEIKEWMKLRKRLDENQIDLLSYLKRTAGLLPISDFKTISTILEMNAGKIRPRSDLDAGQLFEEIEQLENALAARFITEAKAKRIFEYYRSLNLLLRLNELKLTPPEFEATQTVYQKINAEELADFIAQNSGKSLVLSKKWRSDLKKAVQFYKLARSRDAAIENALSDFAKNPSEKIAILVFGGFHKEDIQALLAKQGFSALIVSPKISGRDPKHQEYYKRLMSAGYYSFEAPFLPGRATRTASLIEMKARPELRAIYDAVSATPNLPYSILANELEKKLESGQSQIQRMNIRPELRTASSEQIREAYLTFKFFSQGAYVSFSSDSKKMIARTHDDAVNIFDLETGEELALPAELKDSKIKGAFFVEDAKKIALISASGRYLWIDLNTEEIIDKGTVGTEKIYSIIKSENENRVVIRFDTFLTKLGVIDLRTKENYAALMENKIPYLISPKGNFAVAAQPNSHDFRIYDLDQKIEIKIPPGHGELDASHPILFSSDENYVRLKYKGVRIFRTHPQQEKVPWWQAIFTWLKSLVTRAWHPWKALGENQGSLVQAKDLQKLIGNNAEDLTFSNDSKYAVAIYSGDRIKLFDLKAKREIALPEALFFPGIFFDFFSKDSQMFLAKTGEGIIKIFDLATKEELGSFAGPINKFKNIVLLPDKQIITFSYDMNMNQFSDLKKRRKIEIIAEKYALASAFSPDGKWVQLGNYLGEDKIDGGLRNIEAFSSNPIILEALRTWKEDPYHGFMLMSLITNALPVETDGLQFPFYSDEIKRFIASTTNYHREAIVKLFKDSRIFEFLTENKVNIRINLQFYIDLIQKNKRLALQILGGVFEATKEGLISPAPSEEEKQRIRNFVEITKGFNPVLYRLYKEKGGSRLQEILAFGKQILNDKAGPNEINAFKAGIAVEGYDADEVLLAVIHKVIPPSGASFITKKESKELLKKHEPTDLRGDVPQTLRALGRFGGGTIQKMERKLKAGETYDPQGEIKNILEQLQYPDSGKEAAQAAEGTAADRQKLIEALNEFFPDTTDDTKKREALDTFLKYVRHNNTLKEKVAPIQSDDPTGLDLLDELFRDKDNLSMLFREVLEKEFQPEGTEIIRDSKSFNASLTGIWNSSQSLEERKTLVAKRIMRLSSREIRNKVLIENLDPALKDSISAALSTRNTLPLSPLEIIKVVFETPLLAIENEKKKFEETASADSFNLKFQVVKGTPYRAWPELAGICKPAIASFERKDFFLLAMIDETREEAVGFVHLFAKKIGGKIHLTVPGIEPSTEFLSQVSASDIYPMIEAALQTVAAAGNFDEIDIPTDSNILSNRKDIRDLAEKRNYKKETLSTPVDWNDRYPFQEVYVVPRAELRTFQDEHLNAMAKGAAGIIAFVDQLPESTSETVKEVMPIIRELMFLLEASKDNAVDDAKMMQILRSNRLLQSEQDLKSLLPTFRVMFFNQVDVSALEQNINLYLANLTKILSVKQFGLNDVLKAIDSAMQSDDPSIELDTYREGGEENGTVVVKQYGAAYLEIHLLYGGGIYVDFPSVTQFSLSDKGARLAAFDKLILAAGQGKVKLTSNAQIQMEPKAFFEKFRQSIRSELRLISEVKPAGRKETRPENKFSLNLEQIIQKAGPTKIFVDASVAVSDPTQTAGELARLVHAGAQVVLYRVNPQIPESPLLKILNSFPHSMFKDRFASLTEALSPEQFKTNVNLVHYSESENGVRLGVVSELPWTANRVVYVAGKAGSGVYALKEIEAIRLRKQLAELEIEERAGIFWVSESKSALIMAELQLQSYVAIVQAA